MESLGLVQIKNRKGRRNTAFSFELCYLGLLGYNMSSRDNNLRCKKCGDKLPHLKACLCISCKEKMLQEKHLCGCGCGKMILRWNLTHCGNIRERRFEFHHPPYRVIYGDKLKWKKLPSLEIVEWFHSNLACPACGKKFNSIKSMYDHFDSRRTICIEIDMLNKIRHKVENEYTCHCGCGKKLRLGRLGLEGHAKEEPWNKGLTKEDDERLLTASKRRIREIAADNIKMLENLSTGTDDKKFNNTSSIEYIIKDILSNNGIKFIHQFNFFDLFVCDFAIPSKKVLIECDGNYWHDWPNGLTKDKVRKRQAKENGWKMLRLWESDIKNDITSCEKRIFQLVK